MFYTKPWADVLIVLLIAVLFFGPKRLPTLGRSLGQGFREFKDGITGGNKGEAEQDRPALTPAAEAEPPATPAEPAPAVSSPPRDSAEIGSPEQRA